MAVLNLGKESELNVLNSLDVDKVWHYSLSSFLIGISNSLLGV
jgi:hypothetical protein